MVHELQPDGRFLRASHHVLAVRHLQPDRFPTVGQTLWWK